MSATNKRAESPDPEAVEEDEKQYGNGPLTLEELDQQYAFLSTRFTRCASTHTKTDTRTGHEITPKHSSSLNSTSPSSTLSLNVNPILRELRPRPRRQQPRAVPVDAARTHLRSHITNSGDTSLSASWRDGAPTWATTSTRPCASSCRIRIAIAVCMA